MSDEVQELQDAINTLSQKGIKLQDGREFNTTIPPSFALSYDWTEGTW